MKRKRNNGTFFTLPVIISGSVLLIILFTAVFADLLVPYDPEATDYTAALAPAFSTGHLLGTDKLGRDLLSRLLCGAQTSLLDAVLIVAFEMVLGLPLGLICGYYGGRIDELIMRVCDTVCAIPGLLLAMVFVSALGKRTFSGVIAMGIVYTPMIAKLTRALVLKEKKSVYVETCYSLGFSDVRIMAFHILPNIFQNLIVEFTLDLGYAITSMATLSFLGLGVQAPDADWGTLLKDGMSMLYVNPVLLIAPAFTVMITSISINMLSDGIQAYRDPDQRKLPGFKAYRKRLLKRASVQEGERI